MSWVWEHSAAKGNRRLVLLAIADAANDDGGDAFPGPVELQRKTKLGERTIHDCVAWLVAHGELAIQRRGRGGRDGGRRTVYRVVMDSDSGAGPAPEPPAPPQRPTGQEQPQPRDRDTCSGAGPAPIPPEMGASPAAIRPQRVRDPAGMGASSDGALDGALMDDPSLPVLGDDLTVIAGAAGAGHNDNGDGGQPDHPTQPERPAAEPAAPVEGGPAGRDARARRAITALKADLAAEQARGHRSWDLAGLAQHRWVELLDRLGGDLAPAQRFLAWYVAELTGTPLDLAGYQRAMLLVRRWRALAIYGADQAAARGLSGPGLWTYAERVCKHAITEQEQQQEQEAGP
jgi:hypothetical protein